MTSKRQPAVWRPMTEDERKLALLLAAKSFTPGTADKRFARDIAQQAALEKITDKQAAWLRRLVHKYRRQFRAEDVPEAERHLLVRKPGAEASP